MVVLIFPWSIVLGRGELAGVSTLAGQTLLFLTLSGLATGLSWVCYFQAFQSGLASSVSTLDKTSLVMTLTLANDLPGELMPAKAMIGIALIVAGTVVLVR